MNRLGVLVVLLVFACSCGNSTAGAAGIVWDIDNLESIGGQKPIILGSPKVIETNKGKAVEFDGVKDALVVGTLPLAGTEKFTLEVIFRPDPNSPGAHKFLHMEENNTKNRILMAIEIPPSDSNQCYLDTYIKSTAGSKNLNKPARTHPAGRWYNATLVYDGQEMRHYVNGVKEASAKLRFSPLSEGKTSIGAKLDQKTWFKGAIRTVRITQGVLKPEEFLKP